MSFLTLSRCAPHPDPGYFAGPFVVGVGGMALVTAGLAGTALVVAAGVSAGFDCFSQPPTNTTDTAILRRIIFLMTAIYWFLTVMLLSTEDTP